MVHIMASNTTQSNTNANQGKANAGKTDSVYLTIQGDTCYIIDKKSLAPLLQARVMKYCSPALTLEYCNRLKRELLRYRQNALADMEICQKGAKFKN